MEPDEIHPVIHIGYPKSGSTTLQRLFTLDMHSQYLRKTRADSREAPEINVRMSEFYQSFCATTHDFDIDSCTLFWNTRVAPALDRTRTHVLSAEAFTENHVPPTLVAQRLKAFFGSARIVVIVRRQQELLRSLYEMRPYRWWKNERSFCHFSAWLEDALSQQHKCITGSLFFDRIIADYQRLFGKENTATFLFERLFSEESEQRRLAQFAKMNEEDTIKNFVASKENAAEPWRIRRAARRLLRPLHASTILPRHSIQRAMRVVSRIWSPSRTALSTRDLMMVRDVYADSNNRLEEQIQEQLRAYGYLT